MKRRLIYGLLVCLFVCAGGMVGYGQTWSVTGQNLNGNTATVESVTSINTTCCDFSFSIKNPATWYTAVSFQIRKDSDIIRASNVSGCNVSLSGDNYISYSGFFPNNNKITTLTYYVKIDGNTINFYDEEHKPSCGPQPPVVNEISNACISTIDLGTPPSATFDPTSISAQRTGHWELDENTLNRDLTVADVGKKLRYVWTDNIGTGYSNELTLKDKPSISNIADISYCAALGAYDLSAHVVSDNGASATTVWKRNENTITSNPNLESGDVLYVLSSNECGDTEESMNVTNGCRPQIPTISNPPAICNGGTATLTVPASIEYFDASTDSYEWQIYENSAWRTFIPSETLDYDDYRGSASIRLAATNDVGTSYSNEITVTINSDAPDFTVSESGNCFEQYHGIPNEIEYSFNKSYPCNTDVVSIVVSGADADKFNLFGNTISLIPNLEEGTYAATVTFSSGGYEVEKELSCVVSDYPKTYTLKRCKVGTCNNFNNYNEWEDFEITTDSDGNLSLTMPSDNGYLYVNTSEIICNTFNLNSSASDHGESRFLNVGKLQASESLNIGSSSNRVGGDSPFVTECSSVMIAPTINLYTKQSTDSLKGVFRSESFNLNHDQGGSIEVKECTFIKSTEATIYISGGSMEFNMKGHLISDEITINNPTTYVNMDGIMTVGSVTGGTKIIVGKKATVNLCVNPSQGGDNMGMIAGNVLYNYGDFVAERGWGVSSNPKNEVDINDPEYVKNNMWRIPGCASDDINNVNLIKAYASYDDCIAEKNMAALLPIELISFNYQKGNNTFVWETASETNNDYFVVEYSRNGKDWVECSGHVSSVSANGYSYSVKPNMSINNSLFSYFRLKQVDNNGAYSYSNVITVSFSVDNPCSEEYESSKVQIREMGGKWFRVINGELIYCENDN